eukprot:m.51443 g.51443  ORF g.51443 m.51443 type:complete len:349 (+) comp6306_c0_seq3:174-1220(+)
MACTLCGRPGGWRSGHGRHRAGEDACVRRRAATRRGRGFPCGPGLRPRQWLHVGARRVRTGALLATFACARRDLHGRRHGHRQALRHRVCSAAQRCGRCGHHSTHRTHSGAGVDGARPAIAPGLGSHCRERRGRVRRHGACRGRGPTACARACAVRCKGRISDCRHGGDAEGIVHRRARDCAADRGHVCKRAGPGGDDGSFEGGIIPRRRAGLLGPLACACHGRRHWRCRARICAPAGVEGCRQGPTATRGEERCPRPQLEGRHAARHRRAAVWCGLGPAGHLPRPRHRTAGRAPDRGPAAGVRGRHAGGHGRGGTSCAYFAAGVTMESNVVCALLMCCSPIKFLLLS